MITNSVLRYSHRELEKMKPLVGNWHWAYASSLPSFLLLLFVASREIPLWRLWPLNLFSWLLDFKCLKKKARDMLALVVVATWGSNLEPHLQLLTFSLHYLYCSTKPGLSFVRLLWGKRVKKRDASSNGVLSNANISQPVSLSRPKYSSFI